MAQADFYQGKPLMIDHTPGSAVTAGNPIVVNGNVRIPHSDIPANELGSVAVGGGVYRVNKASALAIDDGDIVYWVTASSHVNKTASGNTKFGRAVAAAAANDTTVLVHHQAN